MIFCVFSHKISRQDLIKYKELAVVPIGKKFKNIKTKIIKNELYIGGPTLCEGYIVEDQNKKAFVTINKQKFYKKPEESVFIPTGAIHRIENHFKKPVKIIEVQPGPSLKETDIVRYQDIYGRIR